MIMAALRSRCGHYIVALWFLSFFFLSLWSPCVIGQTNMFLPCGFYLSSPFFFFFFPSPNLSDPKLNVYQSSTHGVALVRI